jgi:hypothetical protein
MCNEGGCKRPSDHLHLLPKKAGGGNRCFISRTAPSKAHHLSPAAHKWIISARVEGVYWRSRCRLEQPELPGTDDQRFSRRKREKQPTPASTPERVNKVQAISVLSAGEMARSESDWPFSSAACTHFGGRPRPAQVSAGLSGLREQQTARGQSQRETLAESLVNDIRLGFFHGTVGDGGLLRAMDHVHLS